MNLKANARHMHKQEFVDLATKILAGRDVYEDEDEIILITKNQRGLDLEITRKSMPEVAPELSVENPVTMVSKGVVIRHHGEHCFLTNHMADLAAKLP